METYLVGGAVRDRLLGLPVREKDWVVTGATPADMQRRGFRPVGKDFPVFLHPTTGEEYALARTERKIGKGHKGFECSTEAVTLEDDLKRRDLTINAIAADETGKLIDPWGGQADIARHVLRHVSDAFEEDPLRVLRVARFAARFHNLGFSIAPETMALIQRMVERGDMAELTPERIWLEVEKALNTDHPEVFFIVLARAGVGAALWPEIPAAGVSRLADVCSRSADIRFRYAALLLDLSPEQVLALGKRLRAPNRLTDFARLAAANYDRFCEGTRLAPHHAVDLLYATDAFRQPARFADLTAFFMLVSDAVDARQTARHWRNCLNIAGKVSARDVHPDLQGSAIGGAIRAERVRRLRIGYSD